MFCGEAWSRFVHCIEGFFGKKSTLRTEMSEREMAINLQWSTSELHTYIKIPSVQITALHQGWKSIWQMPTAPQNGNSRAELQPCVINPYGDMDGWWCKETVLGSGNLWESSPKTACRSINQTCAASKTIKDGWLVDKPVEKYGLKTFRCARMMICNKTFPPNRSSALFAWIWQLTGLILRLKRETNWNKIWLVCENMVSYIIHFVLARPSRDTFSINAYPRIVRSAAEPEYADDGNSCLAARRNVVRM